jgi:hypothetical protein
VPLRRGSSTMSSAFAQEDSGLQNCVTAFVRTIAIDYSGAQTPTASLPGLRVYWPRAMYLRSRSRRRPHHANNRDRSRAAIARTGVASIARRESRSTTALPARPRNSLWP